MKYGPLVRIILRYIIGGLAFGSVVAGEEFASDPDLVAVCALAVSAIVEASYALAKRKGWAT